MVRKVSIPAVQYSKLPLSKLPLMSISKVDRHAINRHWVLLLVLQRRAKRDQILARKVYWLAVFVSSSVTLIIKY